MKHGRDEEDRGSAASDTTVSSAARKQQALRFAEDLSLPTVCSLYVSIYDLSSGSCLGALVAIINSKVFYLLLLKLSVLASVRMYVNRSIP
jgi:hypothetical protein